MIQQQVHLVTLHHLWKVTELIGCPLKTRSLLQFTYASFNKSFGFQHSLQPWISFKSLSLACSLSMTCNRSVFSQSLTPRQQERHLCTCLSGEWWLIAACFPGTRRSRETARRKCWRGSASPSRPTGAAAERATRRPENSPPRARKNRKQRLRWIQVFSSI